MDRSSAWTRAIPLILLLATAAVYHNSLGGVFLFDDQNSIRDNPHIRALWPPGFVLSAPPDASIVRRPLVSASFALNYAAGELDETGYHFVNIAIHALVALLLFGVIRRTLAGTRVAARYAGVAASLAGAAALLWTVHPLNTEVVDYTVQRTESLAALFILLTLYCVIRSVRSKKAGAWQNAAIASCALGMMCKELAAVAPILVLLYDRSFLSGSFASAWRERRTLYVGLAATWLVLLALILFVPADHLWGFGFESYTPFHALFTQAGVILHYLRLAVWPSPLILDYDGWVVVRSITTALPQIAIVLALVALTVWALRRRPAIGFLGAWFFLILAPTSSFLPLPTEIAAERRMYMPLAALAVLGVLAWREWVSPALRKALPNARAAGGVEIVIVVALAATLGYATYRRNIDYRDERAMWQGVIAKRPESPRAHLSLGIAEMRRGNTRPALDAFDEAIALRPAWSLSHFHRASALRALGRDPEALDAMREAVRLNPGWSAGRLSLGASLLEAGRHEEAITLLNELLETTPNSVAARNNLGFAYLVTGRIDDAIREFEAVLLIAPDFARAHHNLGKALMTQGKNDEALRQLTEAVRLDPRLSEAWNSLGLLKAAQGRREEAMGHFSEAVRLNPQLLDAYTNLAMSLAADGRLTEAVQVATQAVAVKPESAPAHHSLGLILSRAGRGQESIAALREAVRLAPEWPEALNNLAWALATSPDATLRDGREAVTLAERACTLTDYKLANVLDTLGAAYAETGRFADASRTAAMAVERASALGQQELVEQIARRRDAYDARRPYHEPS
jgi:tetratricopeptide (TPR) repeat protein